MKRVLGTLFLLSAGLAFFGCTKKDENKALKLLRKPKK